MTDFEDIAIRSFDEPLDADDRAALIVWADALESRGEPRGRLIAMELAMREQPHRRRELMAATKAHLAAHGQDLLGSITPLLHDKRALELDWRAGRLYGAFLDTRYIAVNAKLLPHELVDKLLAAPATRSLRRLHVRVRRSAYVPAVMNVLARAHRPPPLEEVVVMPGVRPHRLDPARTSGHRDMCGTYPQLRLLIVDGVIVPLPAGRIDPSEAGAPGEPNARMLLGRSLVAADESLRAAAVERVESLGTAAFMYVDTLLALVEPRVVRPQALFVRCLRAIAPDDPRVLRQLLKVAGRGEHYDRDTLAAANATIAALRSIPPPSA